MCGIFGYTGKRKKTPELVLEALKQLEYRGYDSWGVGVLVGNKFAIDKHAGKIGNATVNLPDSSFAFGHTRWATHGGVTDKNAHPHLDCTKTIAVVHNGIIENYQEIRKKLSDKHKIISETDTEIMAHLIEEYREKYDTIEATRLAFLECKGLSAFLIADAKSEMLIAVKTGSPLVVGVGQSENIVGSDANCLLSITRDVVFLENNQLAILTKDKVNFLDVKSGKEITPQVQRISWKEVKAEKGNFPHFLLKEIYEQPQVIENIALNFDYQARDFALLIKNAVGTFMLGCGSASYAALAGTYLFSRIASRHVNFTVGSEFLYLEDYLTPKSLLIPISQSGETIDIVEPVEKARKKGTRIASITNVLGSTLYRKSDFKILMGAGVEKAVIGTKSFTAMVSILLLIAYALVGKQQDGKKLLLKAAKSIKNLLTDPYLKLIDQTAELLKNKEHIYVLGRGVSYAAALETTLKLKETSYIHAEGFAGGELKHGVMALIEQGTPCIVIAPNDETYPEIISNALEVKSRGAFVIGVGPKNNEAFDVFFKTDDCGDATIIPQVVIAQLLAYKLALLKGISDPDKPRNLAKSVTVK
ncbi:glutamine--fructose-6-phosphate transaminase (isomerizing) [Candidatus Daviesbacteria bacterium]|nr:glutamine--fructose-6-phosphate transaminase (isomerizing) [Candidatus Daviesbacteria bacterium]